MIEQLEEDGSLRTLVFTSGPSSEPLVIAYADEYDEIGSGPFHFHDETSARNFDKEFAKCKIRHVPEERLKRDQNRLTYETSWEGIPTERNSLTYFALSLPQGSALDYLSVTDPLNPGRELKRKVIFDRRRHRQVIYLLCSSRYGNFNFRLSCKFVLEAEKDLASYSDDYTTDQLYIDPDTYMNVFPVETSREINNFFQVQAIQINGSDFDIDPKLAGELSKVYSALHSRPETPATRAGVVALATALKASSEGDKQTVLSSLKEAGHFVLDVAKEVGAKTAAEVISRAMGLK